MTIIQKIKKMYYLENHEFIKSLFRQFMNREPDEEGFSHIQNLLLKEASKIDVILQVIRNDGVKELYCLDAISLNRRTIAYDIKELLSLEGTQFINNIYNEILSRKPQDLEIHQLSQVIKNTNSKLETIINFLDSPEFRALFLLPPIDSEIFDDILPGDIAIDCGACVGDVVDKLIEKNAIVYAFEPNPFSFEILEKKYQNNPDVVLINKGVWNKNDTLKLYQHTNSKDRQVDKTLVCPSIIDTNPIVDLNHYTEIEVIDLTEFIVQLNKRIKFLKIDIEGAEFDVIEKIINLDLYKEIDIIVVETHDWLIQELEPKAQLIKNLIKEKQIKNIDLDWW